MLNTIMITGIILFIEWKNVIFSVIILLIGIIGVLAAFDI